MKREEIGKMLYDYLAVHESELTEKEHEAIEAAAFTFSPHCGNCKFHYLYGTLKRGKTVIDAHKCTNPNSEYRRQFTMDFITCTSWVRRGDEEDTTKPIVIGIPKREAKQCEQDSSF